MLLTLAVPTAAHSKVSAFFVVVAILKFVFPNAGGSVAKVAVLNHQVSLSIVFIVPEFRCQFRYSSYLSPLLDIKDHLNAVVITSRRYILPSTATV
jgi:hypothetical protein